jgi:hypothetical protein
MDRTPIVICTYRVKAGNEDAFTALLERHWPTLRKLDFVTADPPQHFRGFEQDGSPLFVEIFTWKAPDVHRLAAQHPDVVAIWEPMDRLTESRAGRPNMEFPHVSRLALRAAA